MLVRLTTGKDIFVGKLGYIHFPGAFYAYVGSAMNGLEARLSHHLRTEKKPHWHIDYLLREAEIVDITLCPGEAFASCHSEGEKRPKNLLFSFFPSSGLRVSAQQDKLHEESHSAQGRLRTECFLAWALAKEFDAVPGFGSSDCKCESHLYFASDRDRLKAKVMEVVSEVGLGYEMPRGSLTCYPER